MPRIPSGVLYFSVWKYLFFGLFLVLSTLLFRNNNVFEMYPVGGISVIISAFLLMLGWFEYGDAQLFVQWGIDAERSNCDRLFRALLYVICCAIWPKFVN